MKQKVKIFTLAFMLVFLVSSVNLGQAATLTWHSSVKKGATFNWKVAEYSGEIASIFTAFKNVTKDSKITVNVTGDPPTVGDWSTIVFSTSVAFADLIVDGEKSADENAIFFLMGPVDIGNTSHGWDAWIFLLTLATWAMNVANFKGGNYTDGSKITYEMNNTGGSGNSQWALSHTLTYDNTTGLMQKYVYEYSNTTLASKITISLDSGGLLGDIPGFEFIPVLGAFLATVIIIHKRKRE
ncbi:MAG: Heimdall-CTERM domain-containing surface protein [Candidatus Hodarchaeales archaeon]